jgi:hypothetical protein
MDQNSLEIQEQHSELSKRPTSWRHESWCASPYWCLMLNAQCPMPQVQVLRLLRNVPLRESQYVPYTTPFPKVPKLLISGLWSNLCIGGFWLVMLGAQPDGTQGYWVMRRTGSPSSRLPFPSRSGGGDCLLRSNGCELPSSLISGHL